jgi:hypothetical protein
VFIPKEESFPPPDARAVRFTKLQILISMLKASP